jgi:2-polyprenyl-6-methoxyphenol hydroxylase-like FAD-dependent oxidoreductase
MRTWNIAIAGCGTAGLAAALLLQRDGHSVTLFERFEHAQPLGSGLIIQPTGLAVLRAMDLDAPLLAAGSRIERLFGRAIPSGRTVLDVRFSAAGKSAGFGVGIHRASLFEILFQAVRAAGTPVETGRTVTGAPLRADGSRDLAFADGTQAGPFDLVVDTLGASSRLVSGGGRPLAYGALWATLDCPHAFGFQPNALEQRYVRSSKMVGVLPIGAGPLSMVQQAAFFWSLREDRLAAWREAGLDVWKREVLKVWPETAPLLDQITRPDQLTFARYIHRTLNRAAEPSLVHIGDAWHSTSPQLGQGANMALLDAFALAKALREKDGPSAAAKHAIALRRRHVWLYQVISALFTPVYQSDSRVLPWLRDRIAGRRFAMSWPANAFLAAMVSGTIGWPLRRLGLDRYLSRQGEPRIPAVSRAN